MRLLLSGFRIDPVKAALCVHLTRILLPAQLCFFAGGVFAAVLLVRKQFAVQAVTPLIYNLGTFSVAYFWRTTGCFVAGDRRGGGAFCGPFLLNAVWAQRAGMRLQADAGLVKPRAA